jgi:hypothetical protein
LEDEAGTTTSGLSLLTLGNFGQGTASRSSLDYPSNPIPCLTSCRNATVCEWVHGIRCDVGMPCWHCDGSGMHTSGGHRQRKLPILVCRVPQVEGYFGDIRGDCQCPAVQAPDPTCFGEKMGDVCSPNGTYCFKASDRPILLPSGRTVSSGAPCCAARQLVSPTLCMLSRRLPRMVWCGDQLPPPLPAVWPP